MIHLELEVISLKQKLPCILSLRIISGMFTIISRARVGYEMIDSQRGAYCAELMAIIISYPTSASGNNCFTKKKKNQESLLGLVDFARRQFNGAISWAWYNVSFTMVAY